MNNQDKFKFLGEKHRFSFSCLDRKNDAISFVAKMFNYALHCYIANTIFLRGKKPFNLPVHAKYQMQSTEKAYRFSKGYNFKSESLLN